METQQQQPQISVRDQTNDPSAPRLPRYRSHKIVEALKIHSIDARPDGTAIITPDVGYYAPFEVSVEYVAKHEPRPGGYWVRYADGYESWSPAEAFESGYSAVGDGDDDGEPTPTEILERLIAHFRERKWAGVGPRGTRRLELALEDFRRGK